MSNTGSRTAPREASPVNRDPDTAAGWLSLAKTQRSQGDLEKSLASAMQALESRPGWPSAVLHAAALLAGRSEGTAFREMIGQLGLLEERAGRDLRRSASLSLRAGAWNLAQAAAKELLRRDPADEEGLYVSLVSDWEIGDDTAVTRASSDYLTIDDPQPLAAITRFFQYIDDTDSAQRALDRIVSPPLRLVLSVAEGLLRRGEAGKALPWFGRALSIDPEEARAVRGRNMAVGSLRLHRRDTVTKLAPASVGEPGRILHLLHRSVPHHHSGGSFRTHYIAKAQRRSGLDPHMLTRLGFPWDDGVAATAASDVVDGIPYYRARAHNSPSRLDESIDLNFRIAADLVEQIRPAVLHPASDYVNALVALRLRDRFDIPIVYEVRGFPEERLVRRPHSRALLDTSVGRRELELQCWLEADAVVTLAHVMKAHLESRGVPSERITVVPNAVDADAFAPRARDPALARNLCIAPDDVVLGYVSTFNSYEGIGYLIEAVARLAEKGHPVRGLLVGDGRERSKLESLAVDYGMSDRVSFTGRVPHESVLDYYALIDVFVVPRTNEATSQLVTPLKPYEAMAMGRAVVVSDVAALCEMVIDGETGLVFEADSAAALADLVESLIVDPSNRKALGSAARAWVQRHRSWDANAQLYRGIYGRLGAL